MNTTLGFIIDLDGTLYRGHERLPYAVEFIEKLKILQIPFLLATNNSSRTPDQVVDHLFKLGIEVDEAKVLTTAQVTASYLKTISIKPYLYVIGEEGLFHAIRKEGMAIVNDTSQAPNYVIQGIDRSFNYEKLQLATQYISEGAAFIMTNPDLRLPSDRGLLPGAGSIGAAIQAASGVTPTVIGKPSSIMMQSALERMQLKAEQVWVIGDNLLTDIAFGAQNGCQTALLLTGVTTMKHIDQLKREGRRLPDLICEDLQELGQLVLKPFEE